MKAFLAVGLVALVVCGSALAKFRITIAAGDTTPAVGQRVTFVVVAGVTSSMTSA